MGCCEGNDEERDAARAEGGGSKGLAAGERCTDVLWLILFVLFWVVMIAIAAFAFIYGSPTRVINGYDSYGNTCGMKHNPKLIDDPRSGVDTSDKPYVLFFDLKHLRSSLKVCVKRCPKRTMTTVDEVREYHRVNKTSFCAYGHDVAGAKESHFTTTGPCPKLPIYNSFSILHRCVPKRAKEVAEELITNFYKFVNSWATVEQIVTDLYSAWKELLIFAFVALILSFVMVSILHLVASLVSWIFMIIVSISCIFGTCLLWYTYYELKNNLREVPENSILSESLRNEKAFLWYSIIATIITVIILLLVFVMRKRVAFLSALFKETASCLGSIPGLFIQPIITFFFLIVFFAYWIAVVACLATARYPGIRKMGPDGTPMETLAPIKNGTTLQSNLSEYIDFVDATWVKGMWWFYFIGLIWTSEFILACQQMTIAGAVTHWYFRGPHAETDPVMYSIGKLLKYHIGSVAKGSFLITLFKVPRLIMTYIHAKLKAGSDKGSECAKCGLKCGICCFYCLEKFIAYLNHNAYTIIAIESVHFCKAAGIAFTTLMSNALQVITINSVGDFILFLGKITVTAITGSVGLIMLKRNQELNFYAAPTLVICIFAFFISHCILSLYEMVVDTLFMCVCEDRKINGAEGRWNNGGLATFAEEPPSRKSRKTETDAPPGTEMQALQSE